MKSAKEQFEDLGYKLYNQNIYLEYVKEEEAISFYINEKTFCKCNGYEIGEITLKELQAINKQVEELHWNDTTVNIDVKLDGKKVMEAMRGGNNA